MPETRLQTLQRQHAELYAQADELINKPGRGDAEDGRAADLIAQCRTLKTQIERERQLERDLAEHSSFRTEPVRDLPHPGAPPTETREAATRHGTRVVGSSRAGHVKIDSYGTILEDIGPGTMGQRAWDATQDPHYAKAFRVFLRKGLNGLDSAEFRALEAGLDGQGGVFVPIDTLTEVVQRKPTPTRLAGLVRTLTTGRDIVQMPRVTANGSDDRYASPFRVTWGDTHASESDVDVSTPADFFGVAEIPVHTAMMSCPISRNLIDDSAFAIQSWVTGEYSAVKDLVYDDMILNGTGVLQPRGILQSTGSTSAFNQVPTTNVGNPLTADGILSVTGAIEEQYDENQITVMRKTSTWLAVRKLKDSQNRYLVGMDAGSEAGFGNKPVRTVDGYPVLFSGFMPATGAANNILVCGDFGGYYLAQRLSLSIQVLRETRAKRNQVEILASLRFGGNVVEPWRFRVGVQS
jgi:HK97 family phage major capsid protein